MHVKRFGLSKKEFYKIINVLKRYSHEIEKAFLFGSRARGDYKSTSDIDIAVVFRSDDVRLSQIKSDLVLENIIYTMDIINYHKVSNSTLKNAIDSEGVIIFLSNNQGAMLVTKEKIKSKIVDLERANQRLQESLLRDAEADDIVVDAIIKRFEFTYELSWKLMKTYLEYNGNLDGTSPRRAIQEAFKIGLIKDGDSWLAMLEDRNRTTHTYDESTAGDICLHIKNNYAKHFVSFIEQIKLEISKG